MAEGGEDEQSPKKTTTYQRFEGMNSQKSRYGVPDNEMFWLENIMRVAPKKLHSVPGPTAKLATYPIFSGCPSTTLPTGTQDLSIVHCYQYNEGLPPGTQGGNSASQLNFVTGSRFAGTDSFVTSVSVQSGFGIPYNPPPPDKLQIIEASGDTLNVITTLPVPSSPAATFIGQSSHAGSSGHSDELSILFFMGGITPPGLPSAYVYFNYQTNVLTYFEPEGGTATQCWAKRGDRFWWVRDAPGAINRYSVSAGGLPIMHASIAGVTNADFIRDLVATDNFLYLLYNDSADATIFRLNLDTLAIVDSWVLTDPLIYDMDVESDDLIYLNGYTDKLAPQTWTFSYFVPSTATLTHIDDVLRGCNGGLGIGNSGQNSFHFQKGYFYMGYGGFGTGQTNITVVGPLNCPGTTRPIGA
jgi:hypothetical protein